MVERHQYPKPPLLEAVLELRFEQNFAEREFIRLRDRLQRAYPTVEELRTFEAKLEAQGAVKDQGLAGFRLTAKSSVDVVVLQQNALITSRLAPYYGWEQLTAQAKANYEAFEKIVGFRRLVRIGARFVNRIDVPNKSLSDRHIGDLLNIKIEMPAGSASSRGPYSLAINFIHHGSGLKVLAQVAVGDPVLIEHTSVFVDLDCAIDHDIPTNIEQVWELVDTMRDPKDDIFESILTPEVRELFQ